MPKSDCSVSRSFERSSVARLPGIRITRGNRKSYRIRIRKGFPNGLQGEGWAKASPGEYTRKKQK